MATAAKDKLTGPGRIEKLPDGSTLLFNFDIDSAVLKPQHAAFLEQNVLRAARDNPGGLLVVIGGSADRLGAAGHNVALSNRRIEVVSAFLKQRMPRYPWTFKGFGQGVGEDNARRAGDEDNTRDDLFRSVIIEVLKPGQPIPPKPSIPKSFPKKPGEVPRPLPRPNLSACLTEQECPASQSFSAQLVVGGTGGEVVEAAFFVFIIKDLTNGLQVLYSLTGGGLGTPGLPVNPAVVGQPTPFRTGKPTKVTNFGPVGGITSLTVPPHPLLPPITLFSVFSFSSHESGSVVPSDLVVIRKFDTGPVSIPGAGIHGGRFEAHGRCRGGSGADRG